MILEVENKGVLVEIFKGVLSLKIIGVELDFWEEL